MAGGTISLPVLAQAKRDGYRELVDLASLGIAYQTTSVAATRRLLAERPATATRLVRALSEAIYVIKTDRPAALAAFGAAPFVFPDKKIMLQYTTTSPKLHKVLGVETPVFD